MKPGDWIGSLFAEKRLACKRCGRRDFERMVSPKHGGAIEACENCGLTRWPPEEMEDDHYDRPHE